MLDGRMLLRCHAHVPVIFWPVLWVYLLRLEATAARARAEGRKGFMWHLLPNGVIIVSFMDASAAERAARGELPAGFDRTPWTRHAPLGECALWARLTGGAFSRALLRAGHQTQIILESDCHHTAVIPESDSGAACLHPP